MPNPSTTFNFLTGSLDSRVTFTRSNNTATVKNANGSISLVSANIPRFNYDNGTLLGLLIEERRENSIINSVFSGASAPSTPPTSWTIAFSTGTFVSVASGTYAAGNNLRFSCSTQRYVLQQNVTLLANTTYAISLNVDIVSGSNVFSNYIAWNGATASTIRYVDGVFISGSANVPLGKHILTLVVTIGASNVTNSIRLGLGAGSNVTGEVVIEMPQLEVGAFSTSYIPTITTAVTRNADVATITDTNFSNWWQAGRGGAIVRATPSTVIGTRPWLQFDDGTADNLIAFRGNTTNPELYIKATTDQAQIDAGTIAANTTYNLTGWWATNDCKARLDSGAVVDDTSATIPTVTQARLGSDGTNYLNGILASIEYYDVFSSRIYTRRKNKVVFSLL